MAVLIARKNELDPRIERPLKLILEDQKLAGCPGQHHRLEESLVVHRGSTHPSQACSVM